MSKQPSTEKKHKILSATGEELPDLKVVKRSMEFSEIRDFLLERTKYPKETSQPDEFKGLKWDDVDGRCTVPAEPNGMYAIIRVSSMTDLITVRAMKVNFANINDVRVVAVGKGAYENGYKPGDRIALFTDFKKLIEANRFIDIDGNVRSLPNVKSVVDMLDNREADQISKEGVMRTEVIVYAMINVVTDVAYKKL